MKLSFRSLVCLCLAVCGILCSGILLGGRISAEAKDQQVSVAFSQDDLALLAQESGLAVETWREALQQAGISHWIGEEPASFLLPGEAVGAATQVPLALVENHDRTSVLLPEGVDLETYDGPMVKTLYLYEDYANRATEGDAQEIENLLFRGVVDRGMRLLLLTPFQTEAGDYVLDPGVYVTCLEDLGARLEARGLALGETFSCLETEPASPLLLLGAGLVPALLGVWLVCRWSRLQGRGWILVVVAVVALAALSQVRPDWMQKGLMLLSAMVFPCVAAWWIAQFARQVPSRLSRHWLAWDGILAMGLVLGWSLLGGLHVAALMASRSYLMGAQIFSGVKVALLLPIVFAALGLLYVLRQEIVAAWRRSWLPILLAVLLFGGICGVFLLRSGDWSGRFSGLETTLRNGLETAFYARPRSKELFLAAPCVPLFLWACRRKVLFFQFFCGVGVCLECVSVVNTFCHGVAPVGVSLIRSLLGAGLGLCLGLVAVAIAEGILRVWRAKGKGTLSNE